MVHDPKDAGAHEDWSRLARLSFDGPEDEMVCSQHAIELLDLIEEVRSMNTGAPVLPVKPGMLFVASPGTNMAIACERGESYGIEGYRRVALDELDELFPGECAAFVCSPPSGVALHPPHHGVSMPQATR